jgi:hypothetical protein
MKPNGKTKGPDNLQAKANRNAFVNPSEASVNMQKSRFALPPYHQSQAKNGREKASH